MLLSMASNAQRVFRGGQRRGASSAHWTRVRAGRAVSMPCGLAQQLRAATRRRPRGAAGQRQDRAAPLVRTRLRPEQTRRRCGVAHAERRSESTRAARCLAPRRRLAKLLPKKRPMPGPHGPASWPSPASFKGTAAPLAPLARRLFHVRLASLRSVRPSGPPPTAATIWQGRWLRAVVAARWPCCSTKPTRWTWTSAAHS